MADGHTETPGRDSEAQRGAERVRFCRAKIFPSWANRWVTCGSAIGHDGECVQYGHRPTAEDAE